MVPSGPDQGFRKSVSAASNTGSRWVNSAGLVLMVRSGVMPSASKHVPSGRIAFQDGRKTVTSLPRSIGFGFPELP